MSVLRSWLGRCYLSWNCRLLAIFLIAAPILARGQIQTPGLPNVSHAQKDPSGCHVYQVTDLPGSHQFASDFIEAIATDPGSKNPRVAWAITADLSDRVPSKDQAIYISKTTNGGRTWTRVARLDSKYFDAQIGEGLRNGLSVSPGGTDFVVTTQEGAFQVFPRPNSSVALVKRIPGPRVPRDRPPIVIAKKTGDPVRAGVVQMTADGKHLIVAYGYFDDNPQLFTYHRVRRGSRNSWIKDGTLPHLPTDLDIFSMQFGNPSNRRPDSLYVGTGDQAYHLNFHTMKWTRVAGVGPDSAIHAMSVVAGLHIAACWGVYNPVSANTVSRVTHAKFLLHRGKDEAGPNIRAYDIAVDPAKPNREVVAAITGVYTSSDHGQSWKRFNNLPEGEFHTAHFNPNGTVLVSGFMGTFLIDPFSNACSPRLKMRAQNPPPRS